MWRRATPLDSVQTDHTKRFALFLGDRQVRGQKCVGLCERLCARCVRVYSDLDKGDFVGHNVSAVDGVGVICQRPRAVEGSGRVRKP